MSLGYGSLAQGWIRLCKPGTSSFYIVSAFLGMLLFVSRPIRAWPLLSVLLVYVEAAGIYILNDVYDIDIDRISSPDRPLPSGLIGINRARVAAFCLLIAGPLLAIWIDMRAAALLAVFGLLGVAYSVPPVRLRRLFIAPSLIIGLGNALGFLIGATLSQGSAITGRLVFGSLLLFAFNVGPSMTKDLSDVQGHIQSRVVSLPVVIGIERAAKITAVIALCSFVFGFLFLAIFEMKPAFYVCLGGCFAFGAWALARLLRDVNNQENVIVSFRLFALSGLGSIGTMILGAVLR